MTILILCKFYEFSFRSFLVFFFFLRIFQIQDNVICKRWQLNFYVSLMDEIYLTSLAWSFWLGLLTLAGIKIKVYMEILNFFGFSMILVINLLIINQQAAMMSVTTRVFPIPLTGKVSDCPKHLGQSHFPHGSLNTQRHGRRLSIPQPILNSLCNPQSLHTT